MSHLDLSLVPPFESRPGQPTDSDSGSRVDVHAGLPTDACPNTRYPKRCSSMRYEVSHEMRQSCPVRGPCGNTRTCELCRRIRDIEAYPVNCKSDLCHEGAIVLVLDRIRKLLAIPAVRHQSRRHPDCLWLDKPLVHDQKFLIKLMDVSIQLEVNSAVELFNL